MKEQINISENNKAVKEIKQIKEKSAGFFKEFKDFILRGNVMDMAIGVIIGAAFKSVVDGLVKDILMPFLTGLIGSVDYSDVFFVFKGSKILWGDFVAQVFNFVLMGFIIFVFVKLTSAVHNKFSRKKEQEQAPTTKKCPYCKSEIDIEATRCPHCTSVLEDGEDK